MQDGNRLVDRAPAAAVLVERLVGFALELIEVTAAAQRAFLDDDDVQAGGAQQFGSDARAGTAANDCDVADQVLVQLAMRAAKDVPTSGQAVGDRIGALSHSGIRRANGPG